MRKTRLTHQASAGEPAQSAMNGSATIQLSGRIAPTRSAATPAKIGAPIIRR
jgi:hypothetical protein